MKDAGVDALTALVQFNLAPLAVRRAIAVLGLIHRTALGKGPPQFKEHFKIQRHEHHNVRLVDPRQGYRAPIIKRSAVGLVAIYNLLPARILAAKSVKAFQRGLQELVVAYATSGFPKWSDVLSSRIALASHPLVISPMVATAVSCLSDLFCRICCSEFVARAT